MTRVVRQATAVAVAGRAILIEGEPGSGKSSLALALIDRGAHLVGDDGVTLELRDGTVWALPPPNTAGLLEIRNVGIARFPATEARVALLLQLSPEAPRLPESLASKELLGQVIPSLALYPESPVLALRAEQALAMHGLE